VHIDRTDQLHPAGAALYDRTIGCVGAPDRYPFQVLDVDVALVGAGRNDDGVAAFGASQRLQELGVIRNSDLASLGCITQ
jgi:hypothetical protein